MSGLFSALRRFTSVLTGVAGTIVWLTRFSSAVTVEPPSSAEEEGEAPAVEPPTRELGLPLKAAPPRHAARRKLVQPSDRKRRVLLAFGTAVATLAIVGGVVAFFTAGSEAGDGGAAQAGTLDEGNQPTGLASDRDVSVSWAQNSPAFLTGFLGEETTGGYLIKRYAESGGGAITPGASCAGLRQGSADPLSCTESALPTGHWQYTVTPKYYNWLGAESSNSASAIVAPEAPISVTLTNGLGQSNAYVNSTNEASVNVAVALPATSLASDEVHLTISDGFTDVSASENPSEDGATTVDFTGLDLSGLLDWTADVHGPGDEFVWRRLRRHHQHGVFQGHCEPRREHRR